jgi:hypothetical protein
VLCKWRTEIRDFGAFRPSLARLQDRELVVDAILRLDPASIFTFEGIRRCGMIGERGEAAWKVGRLEKERRYFGVSVSEF